MSIKKRKIAYIVANGFDGNVFTSLSLCLAQSGVCITNLGDTLDFNTSKQDKKKMILIEKSFSQVSPWDFDAIIVGDEQTAKTVSKNKKALVFIRNAHVAGRLLIFVGSGAAVLGPACIADNKILPNLDKKTKESLKNYKVDFVNKAVVYEENIISAQSKENIQELCFSVIDALKKFPNSTARAA